jgi:hypothetical protein
LAENHVQQRIDGFKKYEYDRPVAQRFIQLFSPGTETIDAARTR